LAATEKQDKALEKGRYGVVLALLGMEDEALRAIEKSTEENSGLYRAFYSYLPLTKLSIYDGLRDDPRFQEIVRKEKEKYEQKQKRYVIW
jgi:hypothetical protein